MAASTISAGFAVEATELSFDKNLNKGATLAAFLEGKSLISVFRLPFIIGIILLTATFPTPFKSSKILVKLITSSGFKITLK